MARCQRACLSPESFKNTVRGRLDKKIRSKVKKAVPGVPLPDK